MTSLEPIALIGHDAVLNGGNLKSNLVPYQLILKIAADATLTKTSTPSKLAGCLSLKRVQWRKRILTAVKHFWLDNIINCSDFTCAEPELITYKIIEKPHIMTTKKINYKRRCENPSQKTGEVKNTKQSSIID